MGSVPAPVIEEEMDDWVALGGGNSGIEGDPSTHFYGFHLSADNTSPDDYSRWRDPNGSDGPYANWAYCCAGDFSHKNNSKLRKMHETVLNRLMNGELPMICEFIGKPWADKPVYYWARWNGIDTLQKYTGTGHDHWSHIGWYRSKADQRAYLWEDDMSELTAVSKAGLKDFFNTDDACPNVPWRSDFLKYNAPEGEKGPQGGTNRFLELETWFYEVGNYLYQQAKLADERYAELKAMIEGGVQVDAVVDLSPEAIAAVADATADELHKDPERDGV